MSKKKCPTSCANIQQLLPSCARRFCRRLRCGVGLLDAVHSIDPLLSSNRQPFPLLLKRSDIG